MKERFKKYKENENLIIATFCDPRYKDIILNDDEEAAVERMIISAYLKHKANIDEAVAGTCTSSSEEELEAEGSKGDDGSGETGDIDMTHFEFSFSSTLDEIRNEERSKKKEEKGKCLTRKNSRMKLLEDTVRVELLQYKSSSMSMKDDEDPVNWWKANHSKYNVLATIANKYLSSPPSSVESERVFSVGGNVYTPHRNRLKPEMGEILMFCNFNLKVFQFNV